MGNDWHLRHAVKILRIGGIVAHATESIFGLACNPDNSQALERLLSLKLRHHGKGFILIGANPEQVLSYTSPLSTEQMRRVFSSWPGPVSWVLPIRDGLDRRLTGGRPSIAVRVTAHPQASQLCRYFGGALVSTSANISGQGPCATALAVRRTFCRGIDFILPGHVSGLRRPSEIREAVSGRILRGA